ncbi:MAG: hypothetical protein ACO1PM_08145 [Acidovorax sp.]
MKLAYVAWVLGPLGFALLIAGVAMVHVPAALMLAGAALMAYAYLADRAAAAAAKAGKG